MATGHPHRRALIGVCVVLAAVVSIVFSPTLRHEFVNFDDEEYFYANSHVQAGLTVQSVQWAFHTTHASNWHPLTWLSLMLDVELFGTGPFGPHLINLFLHAANSVLLFLLLRRLTGAHWRSAFVAALFGLHPLHVESVAWVSERKDVLSGLFFMLTLWGYTRYVEESDARSPKSKVLYGLTLLCFTLGLLSKPMLVTLPFVMLLLDWWPLRRVEGWWRLLVEKVPFLVLSGASCCITLIAQGDAIQPLARIALGIRAVNAVISYASYLWKLFWPVELAIPYPYLWYGFSAAFFLSAILIVAGCAAVIWFGHKHRFLATGWLWYLGMLVPVIGIVQVGPQSMADRYTYLPFIGVFIILAWGAGEVVERWRLPVPAIWTVVLLVLAACIARTFDQLRNWKNSETLFTHAIEVTEGNAVAHYNLGVHYAGKGRLDEALENYTKAVQIRPYYDDALNNLGGVLAFKGQLNEAVARIREAIHVRPDKADAYYNLGNVLVLQKRLDEAVSAYTEALRIKPDYPEAHNNLANVLVMQGRIDEAARHLQEVLRLNPYHQGAQRQLQALGRQVPN